MSCVRNWFGLMASLLMLLNATTAIADEAPSYPCESFGVETGYISVEDLRRLRSLRKEDTPTAAFRDIKEEDAPIINEALRVGPSAGIFSARLLRDLVLIDAFEHQSKCNPAQTCPKPEIIAGFSVNDERSPGKTWQTFVADWKEFRDKDASRSRTCLKVARKLPTFDLSVVARNASEPRGQENPIPRQQAQPPAAFEKESEQPGQGVAELTCRKQASSIFASRQIYFASGKIWLKPADRKFLSDAARSVASCKSLRIALVGHTDSDGPRNYNERLGRLRAEAVGRILRNTASVELKVSGLGESRPARPNTNRTNKAYNRRVAISVL